ncbi:MAG: metallophosphoesterase [Anaerolineae bacterium]|nr:metallophosphoesterase [Anaerolineae bacterium]
MTTGEGVIPNQARAAKTRKLSRRGFLRASLYGALGLSSTALGGVFYTTQVEPDWLDVTRVCFTVPGLAPAFDGYTIAQISDVHLGDWMTRARLRHVIDVTLEQAPDLAVVTGDFVSLLDEEVYTTIAEEFTRLRGADGGVAILGNHDHWTDAPTVSAAVRESGLMLLRNAHHVVERGGDALYIAGVDDIWEEQHDLNAALEGIPAGAPVVLLAHEPDYADAVAADGRVSVQLSGHTHGGQVRLPFVGGFVLPYLGQKYKHGYYCVGDMHLYTNVGVGLVRPAVRFLCRPEVALATLHAG